MICFFWHKSFLDVMISNSKRGRKSMIARRYVVSPLLSKTASIECLNICSHYSWHVIDCETSRIFGDIAISARAILPVNHPLSCVHGMELRFLESSCASMAVVTHMVYEGNSAKITYIPVISSLSKISHLKCNPVMVIRSCSFVAQSIESNFVVWIATVRSNVHFYLL